MLTAELYVDRIDIAKYLTREECEAAGVMEPVELVRRLREGELRLKDCPGFTLEKRYAISLALKASEILPPVQSLELPRPVPPDLYEINEPGADSPVLVTGNSEFTLTVMTGLLAATVSPFFLLLVDCRGDTVDMSMVYRSFTPQRLDQGLTANNLAARLNHKSLIIPGILAPLWEDLASYTGWHIKVGPICAAELPLFLKDAWQPPPGAAV
jgi:CO dehydrogenase/acetyl-CoA synthase gamma subunit (corrinoid Fe-S protein)